MQNLLNKPRQLKLTSTFLLAGLGSLFIATPAWSLTKPSSITVSTPTGSRDTADPYRDDVFLDTITFGTGNQAVTFNSANGIKAIQRAEVISGRGNVNAEYGDLDNNSDGNPNPFIKAGVSDANQESTTPEIQDPSIQAAFSDLSLSEGTDGENNNYTIKFLFENGLTDNDAAPDNIPELIFFERGINSDFSVQAITGGTFENPTTAPTTVQVNRGDLWDTDISIDTVEIGSSQELGAVGIDMNEFGINDTTTPVYGIIFGSTGGGADMYGQFLSSTDPQRFQAQAVPFEPNANLGILLAGSFVGGYRYWRRKASQEVEGIKADLE